MIDNGIEDEEIGPGHARVIRKGRRADEAGEGPVVPLELIKMWWSDGSGPTLGHPFALAPLRWVFTLGFFNELQLAVTPRRPKRPCGASP